MTKFKPFAFFIALMLFMGLTACKDRVPSHIPGKKEMAKLLIDIHLAETTIANYRQGMAIPDSISNGIYKSVLDKHNLTKAQFDSAMVWYTTHPKVYSKVYDDVIAHLSHLEAQAKSDLSKLEEREKKLAELMAIKSLWTDTTIYSFPYPDSLDQRLPFDISVDSIKLGQIRYNAVYKFKKEDMTKKLEMWLITCYADSTQDTIKTEILKSLQGLNTTVTTQIKPQNYLIGLKGYLIYHDSITKHKVDINSIQLEFVPSNNINDYPQ